MKIARIKNKNLKKINKVNKYNNSSIRKINNRRTRKKYKNSNNSNRHYNHNNKINSQLQIKLRSSKPNKRKSHPINENIFNSYIILYYIFFPHPPIHFIYLKVKSAFIKIAKL